MVWILLLVGLFIGVRCCSRQSSRVVCFLQKGREEEVKGDQKIRECLSCLGCHVTVTVTTAVTSTEFWKARRTF